MRLGYRKSVSRRGPVRIRDLSAGRTRKVAWWGTDLATRRQVASAESPMESALPRPPPDWSARIAVAASRENARRTVRPSKAARRTWPTIAAVLVGAGIVAAAVLYLSNILAPTSTVSGNPITISFDPSDTLGGSKFRNTVYDFSIRVEQQVQTTLPVSIRFVASKSAVVCSDLVLKHNSGTLACTQVDASNLQFETATFNVAMSPSASTQLFNVQFVVDGTYAWNIQARSTV